MLWLVYVPERPALFRGEMLGGVCLGREGKWGDRLGQGREGREGREGNLWSGYVRRIKNNKTCFICCFIINLLIEATGDQRGCCAFSGH